MASEMDHEAAISHKILTNFTPIKPVDTAARELTEQVVIKHSSAEGFAYVLLKQWREDTTSSPQRETWGVVQTPVEMGLVYNDLKGGHVSDGAAPAITEDQLVTSVTCEAEKGKLSITTFDALTDSLLRALHRGVDQFPENVSIVMNFGYGLVTFDMAVASTSLVKLIKDLVAAGNNTLALCTVSNNSRGFFGRGWPPRMIHEIDNEESNMDRYEWGPAPAGAQGQQREDQETGDALGLFRRACQQKGDGKRVIMPTSLFQGLVSEMDSGTFLRVQKIHDPGVVYKHKYEVSPESTGANIAINTGIAYLGPVKNVGRVLVPKHVPGFEFDSRSSQVVVNTFSRRSRSEVEYASRFRGEGGHSPQVCCDMTLAEFQSAPQIPTTSPAYTTDLPRLLLIYIYTWAGSDLPLADMPVALPPDEYTVEEQLRRLVVKGLVEVQGPPPNPFVAVGRRRLHSVLKLTDIGSTTAMLLLTRRIESIHVAHFLTQMEGDDTRPTDMAEAAILNIATALETVEGLTQLGGIVDTTRANRGSIEEFRSAAGLRSGPVANLGRGPLWVCLALWYEMRVDQNYRAEESVYRQTNVPSLLDLLGSTGQSNALVINRRRSFEWDRTMKNLREVFGGNQEGECLFKDELSNEDLLRIEQALVRAYLDKLAYIPLSPDIENQTPFAYDLTSNRPIQTPGGPQTCQLDEEYCKTLERLPGGRAPPGIFCFYTYLCVEEDESGRPKWSAQDMTHVSWEAVWRVLNETKDEHEGQDLLNKVETDQVRTP
ncbi:hypothetical protein F5883DRAFT_523885 [Diaporthe sp. PMI_573]|nr:hypothetical protein F5883DRAFT_523885 [Diaporthaceae sp. PMI_573]